MIVTKHKKSKILQDYFFIKGNIPNINADYFINKIEEGIKVEGNLTNKTSVKGELTSFDYFNQDTELHKILHTLMDYYEKNNLDSSRSYYLKNSWGLKEIFGGFTIQHNHRYYLWSGVIYLSDINQPLFFPEINEEIKVEKGNFAIFSPFLNHETKNRVYFNEIKYGLSFNFAETY